MRSLEFIRIDLARLPMGSYVIRPDQVIHGDRLIAQLVVCVLNAQGTGARAPARL